MKLFLAALFFVLISAEDCVPRCQIDEACTKIQSWVDEESTLEAAGNSLTCDDFDERLVIGLSVLHEAAGSCWLEFPTPEHAKPRLQQLKTGGVRITGVDLQTRLAAVLHCPDISTYIKPLCAANAAPAVDEGEDEEAAAPEPAPLPAVEQAIDKILDDEEAEQPVAADAETEPPAEAEAEKEKELSEDGNPDDVEKIIVKILDEEKDLEGDDEEEANDDENKITFEVPTCVPTNDLDWACGQIQDWVDDVSDKELAGKRLGCCDMDHRLTHGLSLLKPTDNCFIDFPRPDHLKRLYRLKQLISSRQGALNNPKILEAFTQTRIRNKLGFAIGRQDLIDRIASVLHCPIPVPCVPLCPPAPVEPEQPEQPAQPIPPPPTPEAPAAPEAPTTPPSQV